MGKDSDLREQLLRQMDRDADDTTNASQKAAQAILARDAVRLSRMRRITVFSWILLAAAFLASGVTGAFFSFSSEVWIISSIIGLQALLIIAIGLTVTLSFRSRTLKMKEIQTALADIQKQLKSMSSDQMDKVREN